MLDQSCAVTSSNSVSYRDVESVTKQENDYIISQSNALFTKTDRVQGVWCISIAVR
jgi:hypothetical protein